MKEHSRKLLDKALDSIEVAEGILDMDKPDMAAGRAYYAMFYVAEAMLYEKGLEFNSHGQVIGAYGKEFAKTEELDQKFHRWLRAGFDARISGDYDVDTNLTNQFVADMINQAREFLEAAQSYLKKQKT
ncbi:MAG TPA: HEPN domain-containing protein [Anaerolineales bacterium]|nr:HEPN domain-containing protein [Anaerolineales bacterium]HNQ95848.1 HEPN domain-containing protein [Anaerolineales bacterium]HNS61945.1 HEPN domain-containing protein [Anaerolineales bacterium]